ncbi:MAG: MotA/TolQ/ExbB proton channel family protein [Verrucomicrobium sp.]|nr:MotA/TolQ/ExbB proton channel family protein [Verrucomicrobium sp.]
MTALLPVLAQAAPPTDAMAPLTGLSLLNLLKSGGWVMVPLFLASIGVVALIGYYFLTLRRGAITTDELELQVDTFFSNDDLAGLAAYLKERPEAVAEVLSVVLDFTLRRKDADAEAIHAIAEAEGNRLAAALNQRVTYLLDLGVLAPLLGLFGTVVGILRSFGTIATQALALRTMMLAGGVSQALVATASGLIVGILAMFCFSCFRGRVQTLISLFEVTVTQRVQEIILLKKRTAPRA